MSINTIYEDDNILIVDKPAGLLVHRARELQEPDLLAEIGHPEYGIITRLDFQTPGLLLLGKHPAALAVLNQRQRQHGIRKFYHAVLGGYFDEPEGLLRHYLRKDEGSAVVRISQTPFAKAQEALTSYRVIKEALTLSLVEIELLTGRTHQIRAVMAQIGHPVAGDPLYGNPALNRRLGLRHQALAAMRLEFAEAKEKDLLA